MITNSEHSAWPVIEGVIATLGDQGETHLSAFGARISPNGSRFLLRPYAESSTHRNLQRLGRSNFHVTDDANLIAELAIGRVSGRLMSAGLTGFPGVLEDHCGWYALELTGENWTHPRAILECSVIHYRPGRPFIGFHRARHALIELAIACTRLEHLTTLNLRSQIRELRPLIDKTGGPSEHRTFQMLIDCIEFHLANRGV